MTGKPPFPSNAGHIDAPPSWRCIDFISDLHLDAGLPATTKAVSDYLASTSADAVFILGDLFEVWLGDDARTSTYERTCVETLAQAAQRLALFIMVGNRDFLVGQDMIQACHAKRLEDPTTLNAFGAKALLIHGDELCLTDTSYLQFRAQVRTPAWQDQFLSKPLAVRQAMAQQMRQASQMHQKQQSPSQWADVDESAASAWMQASASTLLIHGHTHHPKSEPFGLGTRHVLSDWDLDHTTPPRAEVLRWQAEGFTRVSLASAKA